MKRFLFFISICILGLNISCSSDDDKNDPDNPSNATNTIVLNGITYNLTPAPASKFVKEYSGQKIYNTYTVDAGASDGDYCGGYYIVFNTQDGNEIEWWFNSIKDPFNTTYVYSTECGQEQGYNYDSWFLLDANTFGADDKGNSITTSVKNNIFTIKGTFIDDESGNIGTIDVSISDFVIK